MNKNINISIIIPAKNEASSLQVWLKDLINQYNNYQIIVVNDGSTDTTQQVAQKLGATVINHPYSKGNGAAIKTGARHANGDLLIFMDADGQHNLEHLAALLTEYQKNPDFDMIIGARCNKSHASSARKFGNNIYNFLASKIVKHKVYDLTSGLRIVKTDKFKEFLHLLPNGFSYPTTITMAFFRAGYNVKYIPISAQKRITNTSHLHLLKDGIRFFIIIYKMAILYSPLKIFLPIAAFHFFLGLINYTYTFMYYGRFTNMSAVLFSASIIIFLIGLVSEQITSLMYQPQIIKPGRD